MPLEVVLCGVPEELWVAGHEAASGCYSLLRTEARGDRPVFRRPPPAVAGQSSAAEATAELFLWYRGGNWGITTSLHQSPAAAPFLARCADPSGRARHPLELRRPRWQVRRGRSQEDFDPAFQVQGQQADAASAPTPAKSSTPSWPTESAESVEVPKELQISGRKGSHMQVNGCYKLTSRHWNGKPVYERQLEDHEDRIEDFTMKLFFDCQQWVLAPEVCSLPRSIARLSSVNGAAHPAAKPGVWEVLQEERQIGSMVAVATRTFSADRNLVLSVRGQEAPVAEVAVPESEPKLLSSAELTELD